MTATKKSLIQGDSAHLSQDWRMISPPTSISLCMEFLLWASRALDGYFSAYSLSRSGTLPNSHTHKDFQEDWTTQDLQRGWESEAEKGLMREATSPCRTQVPKGKSDSGSGVVKAASLWRSSQEPLLCYKSVKLLFRNSEKCLAWGRCIRAQTTELWAVMAKDVHSQWPTRNLQMLSQLLSVFLHHQEESRSLCSYLWPAPLLPVIHCIALEMPYPTKSSEPSCQMSVGHAPVPADNYGSQGHPFYPPLSSAHNLTCLPSPHDPPPLFCSHGYLDGILWPFLPSSRMVGVGVLQNLGH